jgi:hypothetical protein
MDWRRLPRPAVRPDNLHEKYSFPHNRYSSAHPGLQVDAKFASKPKHAKDFSLRMDGKESAFDGSALL